MPEHRHQPGPPIGLRRRSGIPAVLRVWGAWAILAGLIPLTVGICSCALGGQWPMVLSGGISVLAGTAFILMSAAAASLINVAGYAVLGGIFFLVSRGVSVAAPRSADQGDSAARAARRRVSAA